MLSVPDTPLAERARQWTFFTSWRIREGLIRLIVPRRALKARGLDLSLPCDNWVTAYRWKTYNSKEPETLDWIDTLLDDDVLFDVGANIGLYTLYAARRHPGMTIAAFEPEYSNLHLLRDNVITNRISDRVTIYALGIGDTTGLSYLHIQDLHPGAALHTVSREALTSTRTDRPVVGREGIMQMALDAFCDDTGLSPSCMKIDVDGNEPQVLTGARRTLASPVFRSLLIEMPERESDAAACARILAAAGLHQTWCDSRGKTRNEVWSRS